MPLRDVIFTRRSIKEFTDRVPTREEIEELLEAVCQAPNHRHTEPWRFYVLGPEARAGYGRALGLRKAKKIENEEAAQAVIEKVESLHRTLPAMIAVSVVVHENAEVCEEDYAAAFMGIQNLSLLAHAKGLGTQIMTGAVMNDPNSLAAMRVPEGERVVATVRLGEPAQLPEGKARKAASGLTIWLP